jgi:hypothetical protein
MSGTKPPANAGARRCDRRDQGLELYRLSLAARVRYVVINDAGTVMAGFALHERAVAFADQVGATAYEWIPADGLGPRKG